MKKFRALKIFWLFLLANLFLALFAQAQNFKNAMGEAEVAAGGAGVTKSGELEDYLAKMVGIALSIIGILFLALMIYGGYVWMLAKGDESEAKKAQGIITMGAIGMVIVILAYAISRFVISRIVK
ncbi:MAG: hypothetical protein HY982_02040 [Candidatus Magasanikbacteria bacterium]|nr:hypothetical protein [Candidatus Magasanikbacteria bacterium]